MRPQITFIVSMYNRVASLNACLASIRATAPESEIIVCLNCTNEDITKATGLACIYHDAHLIETGMMGARGCYESAEMVSGGAEGEFLCFASDDSLYVQDFSRIMLDMAHSHEADLVYCDCIYRRDGLGWPQYSVLNVEPRIGKIDKTCFILRADRFNGFPPHEKDWRDGALIEQLIRDGVKYAKAPGALVVHQ